jgi:Tol biopolymer transport system component
MDRIGIVDTRSNQPVVEAHCGPPDGTTIAFASGRHRNWVVYLMRPDGTDQRRLTRNAAPDDNPDWSPDGSQLVFESRRHGNRDLYSIRPDGSGLERITRARQTIGRLHGRPTGR